jgi:hypothetical protein
MTRYDYYNREERAICAHLFRLLHEKLDHKSESPLGQFIDVLSKNNLTFKNGNSSLTNLRFDNISIFCEASIIRDAYQNAKPDIYPFMDDLTKIIMKQEKVSDCRLYSELPDPLNNAKQTHPKQIRQKASYEGIQLNESESRVYGAMQGMFNAKPDLVITIDNILLVCEAKHTESFDEEQLKRTWNIAEVWATLLYKDIGFSEPPIYALFKLGGETFKPDINWTSISLIADKTYNENDRTRIAIKAGTELLKRQRLE